MQNGVTAVHVACEEGHLEVVKVLCSHGASLDITSQVSCLVSKGHQCHWLPSLPVEWPYSADVCLCRKQCGCGAVSTRNEAIFTQQSEPS